MERLAIFACVFGGAVAACSTDDGTVTSDASPVDVVAKDTSVPIDSGVDALTDSADAADAANAPDAADAGPVYNDMTMKANWTTFAPKLDSKGIQGGTFDGRYVYFSPAFGSVVSQYDTTAPFSMQSSWTNFDVSALGGAPKQYFGAVFDGRYVYLVPNASGLVLRYDSQASFASSGSWTEFDTTTLSPSVKGFNGGTFDGQYVYFVSAYSGTVRLDTKGTFTSANAWTSLNSGPGVGQDYGGIFDGKFVYATPFGSATVARYDISMPFNANSWTSFDTGPLALSDAGPVNPYAGASFDGRYAYFVGGNSFRLVRYDTTASFTNAQSWLPFDTSAVLPAQTYLVLSAFDGRYAYVGSYGGWIGRVDTTAVFTSAGSWSKYQSGVGESGAMVFDGRYLYIAGGLNVTRFDAKSPPSMPALPSFKGSFY